MSDALRTDTVRATICGYEVELDFFIEGGEQRCFSCVAKGDYTASIECMVGEGTLEDTSWAEWKGGEPTIEVPERVQDRIAEWASDNGY